MENLAQHIVASRPIQDAILEHYCQEMAKLTGKTANIIHEEIMVVARQKNAENQRAIQSYQSEAQKPLITPDTSAA